MGLSLIGAASCWRELPWPRLRHSAPSRDRLRAHKPLRSIHNRFPPSPNWARAVADPDPTQGSRAPRPTPARASSARDAYFWAWPMVNVYNRRLVMAGVTIKGGRAGRGRLCSRRSTRNGHVHRLCRSGGAQLSPARTRTWCRAGVARARSVARRRAGPGFRRPLLGLSDRRPSHGQLCTARQDVCNDAGLLPAGRP